MRFKLKELTIEDSSNTIVRHGQQASDNERCVRRISNEKRARMLCCCFIKVKTSIPNRTGPRRKELELARSEIPGRERL